MNSRHPIEIYNKFVEEYEKIKTTEELEKFINRLETFIKLHQIPEAIFLLAKVFYDIKEFEKSISYLEKIENFDIDAKLLKAKNLMLLDRFEEALKILNDLKSQKTNEEMELEVIANLLSLYNALYQYDKVEGILNKYGNKLKNYIFQTGKYDHDFIYSIEKDLHSYKKGLTLIEGDEELKEIKKKIEEIADKYFEAKAIIPKVLTYYDGDDEVLFFYIIPERITNIDIVEKFEDEIIEKINFNYPYKVFYVEVPINSKGAEPVVA